MTLQPKKPRLETHYAEPFDAWKKDPNPTTRGGLLRAIDKDIEGGIKAHVGQSNPLLKSRARQLVIKALPNYDQNSSSLKTYVHNQLQGLKRINRQQQQILSIPERVSLDSAYLNNVEADLIDRNGRDPSMQELADFSGLSLKRIKHVRSFRMPIAEGTMAMQATDEDEDNGQIGVHNDQSRLWREIVYGDLDPINQKVMEWTLGMYNQPVLQNQEIAHRLRITPGAVSQRKALIQKRLMEAQELM